MEVSGQLHAPAVLPSRDRSPGTHLIGCWMGSRAGLDAVAEITILTELSRLCYEYGLWISIVLFSKLLQDCPNSVHKSVAKAAFIVLNPSIIIS